MKNKNDSSTQILVEPNYFEDLTQMEKKKKGWTTLGYHVRPSRDSTLYQSNNEFEPI